MNTELAPGQKVRNNRGIVLRVREQQGCQVFVIEEPSSWYHPSKLWATQTELPAGCVTASEILAAWQASQDAPPPRVSAISGAFEVSSGPT